METLNIFIETAGLTLISFLKLHLPVLIIIGGQLVLIDIYHRRFYDSTFSNDAYSKQLEKISEEQDKIEKNLYVLAILSSILIPTLAIIFRLYSSINHIDYFIFGLSYLGILLLIFYKLRRIKNYFMVLRQSISSTYRICLSKSP